MLEKPKLEEGEIIACLRDSYGIPMAGIDFLPIGNDSTAWAYKANTEDGKAYFLKIRKGTVYKPSVVVPQYLKDNGIEQVVAPLLTQAQELWKSIDDFVLILYPFIEGSTGMQIGMSENQWMELGTVLRKIHSIRLSPELSEQVHLETFIPRWSGVVKQIQARINVSEYTKPFETELASFWKKKSEEIGKIVDRAEALGRRLQKQASEFVLCHTDIHTANILLDKGTRMFIVDWDNPLLAPKERDLMFVVGGAVAETKAEELFFRGYGKTDIDSVALAYYRYEWVVQEIGDYGKRVFLMQDIGQETKKDAVQGFLQLFQPSDVVESAYESMNL